MNPAGLMTLSATITRRTVSADPATDDYGNPIPTETTLVAACELQQAGADENTVNADVQRGDWNLFVAPTATSGSATVETDLDGSDTVTIGGVDYEVVGPPWPARNPRTGLLTHIQANLRRTV